MNEPIKAIVTKLWMSRGPELIKAEKCSGGDAMIKEAGKDWPRYFTRKDWHSGKREATDDILIRYMKRKVALKKAMETLDKKRDRALKMIEGMDIL